MNSLEQLQELFKRFPGIGQRQAMRFAYFIANARSAYIDDLKKGIDGVRNSVTRCNFCYALTEDILNGKCRICRDTERDQSLLLVVEKEADRERIITSGVYKGMYFVLGGLLPAIETNKSYMRTEELSKRIQTDTNIQEIILALSATPDGERTTHYLQTQLKPQGGDKKISLLGRGLSTGTEIEYSDPSTIESALKGRT